jgi:predicted RNA-binding Zn-ribbon protein involved in translation (DUF1610 family)
MFNKRIIFKCPKCGDVFNTPCLVLTKPGDLDRYQCPKIGCRSDVLSIYRKET